jgi:hypothetical protein
VIGVTIGSPFGDPERATGALAAVPAAGRRGGSGSRRVRRADRWLGVAAPGRGALGLLRDLAGFTGLAFLTGAVLGGALAWIGPLGYLAITLPTLAGHWTTPWLWPARRTTAARRCAPGWCLPLGWRSPPCAGPGPGSANSSAR